MHYTVYYIEVHYIIYTIIIRNQKRIRGTPLSVFGRFRALFTRTCSVLLCSVASLRYSVALKKRSNLGVSPFEVEI